MPAEAAGVNQTEVLQNVFAGAIDEWIAGAATGLIEDSPVTANGDGEGTVNVFAPVIAPVTILENEEYLADMEVNKQIAFQVAYLCLLIIVLYILLQELDTERAYKLSKFINGQATYYFPKDIFGYAVKVGFWFTSGSVLLFGMVYHNNDMIAGMDTGVLNQVVVSSDNLSNYLTLGLCTKAIKIYFSIRESILVYAMKHWYYLGVIFFFKKSRWVGVILLEYTAVQIYVQTIIVGVLTDSVRHVLSTNPEGSDMLHFASTSVLIAAIIFVAVTVPFWIRILSPSTWNYIINTARRV